MSAQQHDRTVAFVGLGAIGWPMAARLAEARPTKVWARRPEVAERHAAEHGSEAVTLEALADVDVLVTCLPTSAEVEELLGRIGGLRKGAVLVDTTSGDPERSRAIADGLARSGAHFIDAPISGGVGGAERGVLLAMIGGEADVLDRVRPVLDTFCATIVHLGPVGAGHAVKSVNNTLMAMSLWAASEGLGVLRALGVEDDLALDAINGGSGRSYATENHLVRLLRESGRANFSLRLMAKDIAIAASLARTHLGSAPMLEQISQLYGSLAVEHGEEDLFFVHDVASGRDQGASA
jgi:3-hydroxyisobutyrate dehydrogenase